MAELKSIDMDAGKISVRLAITAEEYGIIRGHNGDFIVLPCGKGSHTHELTTGKLGHSNRIMVPKKMMKRFKVPGMNKKVPAGLFRVHDDTYLLVKINKSEIGLPKLEGMREELHESNHRAKKA